MQNCQALMHYLFISYFTYEYYAILIVYLIINAILIEEYPNTLHTATS